MPFPSGTYVGQVPDYFTRQELEQFYSLLQGYLSAEHKEDGRHSAVTADSLAVTGNAAVGGNGTFNGNVTADADGSPTVIGTDANSRPGISFQRTGSGWHIFADFDSANPKLSVRDTGTSDLSFLDFVRTVAAFTNEYEIRPRSSIVKVSLGAATGGQRFQALHVLNGVFERARVKAMGEWTDVAYDAANFTASAGTWTVDSADQVSYAYTLIGKTMILAFAIQTTDVSAAPATLNIAIPGGFTAVREVRSVSSQVVNAGAAAVPGLMLVAAGGSVVQLFSDVVGNLWTTTAADNTSIRGTMIFEVQ